jgi:murein DD-endopeptidase MepM/ murein hydrolase activator NlpD
VAVGDVVEKGQVIGLSGQTGYAAVSHLHLTVRINDVSIDPVVFLKLFNK